MQQVNKQPHVGLALVKYAPLAMLLSVIVAGLANSLLNLNIITLGYAIAGGLVCAICLLMYWLGKGGVFFILGLCVPLLLVLFTPLAVLTALLNLVSGFFFGFFLLLLAYKGCQAANNT